MKSVRAKVILGVGFSLAVVFLLVPSASACCTNLSCPYCVSSSDYCVCGAQKPVCNVVGCNCNNSSKGMCGTYKVTSGGPCVFHPSCSSADTQAKFDAIDTSHDGALSQDEVKAYLSSQPDWLKNANRKSFPAKLRGDDASLDDVVAYGFKKMDANNDGSVSPGELDSSLAPDHKRMKKK